MALRTHEESGDYIKRYFRGFICTERYLKFQIKSNQGTAYVKGYRINKDAETVIKVDKPQETLARNNDSITIDYGNYFLYTDGKKMANFDECEVYNFHPSTGGSGTAFGSCRIRAINENSGVAGTKKVSVFEIKFTDATKSIRDIQSIATSSPTSQYYNIYREGA